MRGEGQAFPICKGREDWERPTRMTTACAKYAQYDLGEWLSKLPDCRCGQILIQDVEGGCGMTSPEGSSCLGGFKALA